jgi:hypothetical protein
MPLLNPPNILPNGMYLIAKYLAQQGGPVDRQRLKALLQPSTLPLPAGGAKTFDVCLKGLRDLGLVVTDGVLVEADPNLVIPQDVRAFGGVLLDACARNDAAVLDDVKAVQRDLLVALTWWCAQDPYGGPVGWTEGVDRMLPHDLGPAFASFPIGNDTAWQAFVRWAVALGFAEHDGLPSKPSKASSTVVPDMTRAVTAVLWTTRWNGAIPAAQAVSFLREALPMVDGGRLAKALREDWNLPPGRRAASNALDVAFSHALLRSADEGVLVLQDQADAPGKVLLSDGPEVRLVSHVVLEGQGSDY